MPLHVPDPAAINLAGRVILLAEIAALMEPHSNRRSDFGPDAIALLDQGGRLLAATDYVDAQRLRRRFQTEWAGTWEKSAAPTTPIVAPLIGQTL